MNDVTRELRAAVTRRRIRNRWLRWSVGGFTLCAAAAIVKWAVLGVLR